MTGTFNLSVVRKLVQLAAFVFFVYGGSVVGFYLADKLTTALPALSCAYDPLAADLCTLIPFQHQMDHRLGGVIAAGGNLLTGLMPTLVTLATFVALFVVLNKAFCGWLCPLGTFQELLHIAGQKLGLRPTGSLSPSLVARLRPVKWFVLVLLVFGFPLLTGLGWLNHDLGDPFCRICPSRILTSLAAGSTGEIHVDTASGTTLALSLAADFLFGLVIALALTVRLPFCRVCPMLAMHAVFRKLGLLRLVKRASPRCDKCGLCAKACPMDIREIHTEMTRRDVTFEDCTLCGRCVEFCPDRDALQLRYLGMPVFRASPAYFKRRKRAQSRWESIRLPSGGGRNRGTRKADAR
jgi:ferredoxin-type protein NapH